jgi:pimeloyl-ACP methyl ester carboxylesterase
MKKLVNQLVIFAFAVGVIWGQAPPKARWANIDGNKVRYYDVGDRKSKNVLVFVHGWTCDADVWKDSYSAFPKYRVIALDLIGHGRSDKPRTKYSMELFAKSINAVMTNAKAEKAVIVGHSMGTPVSRQFYRLYPDKIIGMVVVDGLLTPIASIEAMEKGFLEPLRANYNENQPKLVDGLLQPVKDDNLKKRIKDMMTTAPDYVGIGAMEGMLDPAIWTNDQVKVPVLAIMATSPWWGPDTRDSFQAVAPNIDFQMWTDVSHFLMMEKPSEFNDAVRVWIVKNKLL